MGCFTLPKGGIYVETPDGPLQFGAPSETLKDTLRHPSGVPGLFILGKELFSARRGVALADVEFPAYYQLFAKRRSLKVVGTPAQLERLETAVREAMLGPPEEMMRLADDFSQGVRLPDLKREWAYFRRGPYSAGELSLADALEPIALEHGRARVGGVEIVSDETGFALWWDGEERVRLPPEVPLPAEQEVSHGRMPAFEPPEFGVTALGRSHGFDPDPAETTSGFVLWIGRRGIMVDPPVYSTERLRAAEVDPRFVEGVLLTHCHADHDAGTLQKALEGGTVTLYSTPTIFASYRRKWSALSGIPEADFERLFDFRPVQVGASQDIMGAQLIFRYTLHSIPTIAFEAHFGGRSFNYSSDTLNDPEQVQAIYDDGGLEIERRDELLHFDWDHDLVFHEAGVPPLHTPLEVLADLPESTRRRLRIMHTTPSKMPDTTPLQLAEAGRAGTIGLEVMLSGEARAIRNLSLLGDIKLFRSLPLSKAADLLGAAQRLRFAAGERFIEEGAQGDQLFIITAGKAAVVQGGRELKVYGLGDYIGETAVFTGAPRNADVVAKTDLEVLAIDGNRCRAACAGTDIESVVRRHAEVRELDAWSVFEDTELFSGMSAAQKNDLETLLRPRSFAPGEYLSHEGAVAQGLYIVLDGAISEHVGGAVVGKSGQRRGGEIRTLGRGAIIGQPEIVLEGGRLAGSAQAVTKARAFWLSTEDLVGFAQENPGIRVRIRPWQAKDHLTSEAVHRLLEEYL